MKTDDVVRVVIREPTGHAVRVLDLVLVPDLCMVGDGWVPGVDVADGETPDHEAATVCYAINEGEFARAGDGSPVSGAGTLSLDDDGDGVDAHWTAERVAAGTPKPSLADLPVEPYVAPAPSPG